MPWGGYSQMARLDTSGSSTIHSSLSTTAIADPVIDNAQNAYLVYVYNTQWDGENLKIMGATITYTLPEAH